MGLSLGVGIVAAHSEIEPVVEERRGDVVVSIDDD
jgi:hypothetical protein